MPSDADPAPGLLAAHQIQALIDAGAVRSASPPDEAAPVLQPASLDLRLGRRAWRVRASFLPGRDRTVMDGIQAQQADALDLALGVILEPAP